jgi:hypothetical protein
MDASAAHSDIEVNGVAAAAVQDTRQAPSASPLVKKKSTVQTISSLDAVLHDKYV